MVKTDKESIMMILIARYLFFLLFLSSCSNGIDEKWDTSVPESEDFTAENAFWSSNGERLYFQHDDFSNSDNLVSDDIWLYDFSTNVRKEVFKGRAFNGDINQDESRFIYHKPGFTLYIYSYDIQKKMEVQLTGTSETNPFDNTLLARYSPDYEKILFTVLAGEPRGIAHMNPDGRNAKIIVDYGIMGGWFPNGNKIIYINWVEGKPDINAKQIFEASVDGSNQRQITDLKNTQLLSSPVVSPDGKTIAFGNNGGSGYTELFLLDYQTGKVEQVTKGIGNAEAFAWHPDGKTIVFERNIPNVSKYLYLFDVDTYEVEPLFKNKNQED